MYLYMLYQIIYILLVIRVYSYPRIEYVCRGASGIGGLAVFKFVEVCRASSIFLLLYVYAIHNPYVYFLLLICCKYCGDPYLNIFSILRPCLCQNLYSALLSIKLFMF